MRRWTLAAVAPTLLALAGCEMFLFGAAGSMAMAYVNGDGVKTYKMPYPKVSAAAVESASHLNLTGYRLTRDADETKITGDDADGESVTIRVVSKDNGRAAEVRVRFGPFGNYVPSRVFMDGLNMELGLPPEPTHKR
ncbi:MAG TPA: DUF3568 family protein [Candidatus Brocadiia bacterium]|nr:DUF3568 family protein [Candidatus Brocadiia bacterium]